MYHSKILTKSAHHVCTHCLRIIVCIGNLVIFIILDFVYHIEGYPHSPLHHAMERIPIKLVVVGDGAVGKTSLMFAYTTGEFNTEYVRHMYEGDPQDLTVNEIPVQLTMFEGPTQTDWTPLRRKFLYPDTDVILMCFSLVAEYTYINIRDYWYPEVNACAPNVPVILVGTKMDLLHDEDTLTRLRDRGRVPLEVDDGFHMCKEINADRYMDCSSLELMGVHEIFEEAIGLALKKKQVVRNKQCVDRNKQCILL